MRDLGNKHPKKLFLFENIFFSATRDEEKRKQVSSKFFISLHKVKMRKKNLRALKESFEE